MTGAWARRAPPAVTRPIDAFEPTPVLDSARISVALYHAFEPSPVLDSARIHRPVPAACRADWAAGGAARAGSRPGPAPIRAESSTGLGSNQ